MTTLKNDINTGAEWMVRAFAELGKNLDYSLESLKTVDTFFDEHVENGKPKAGSVLEEGVGSKLFAIGSYVGQTLVKNCPGSVWITDDNDPEGEINIQVRFQKGTLVWPVQRVMKRFKNGTEDSLFTYGYGLLKEAAA